MKKIISAAMMLAITMAIAPVSAYAWTDNHVNTVVNVRDGDYLNSDYAPNLTIEASTDHMEDFSFELTLSGAEWTYDDSGQITSGVTYQKYTDTMMRISVSLDDFDARKKNLRIPLLCHITSAGSISVRVDGDGSAVSSGIYPFATNIDGDISIITNNPPVITNSQRKGTLDDIVINDSTSISYQNGERFTLTLSNGFRFVEAITPETTGKFDGNVEFEVDESKASKAYLVMTSDSDKEKGGKITLSGLQIEPINSGSYGNVNMKIEIGEDSASIKVAEYKRVESSDEEILINDVRQTDNRPLISGTGGAGGNIVIRIDGEDIGKTKVDEDGKWSLPYPENREALKNGEHSVSVGYYRSTYKPTSALINEKIIQFTTKPEVQKESRIVIMIGANYYTLDGSRKDTDTPAMIDSQNRTLIPIRMFAEAMGITDQKWDAETKTAVFIDGKGNTIQVKAGEAVLTLNGKTIAMDTNASIVNDRMMVPMRALMTAFGVENDNISWDQTTKTITIIKK